MRKIIFIILIFFPLFVWGQKTNVRTVVTGTDAALYRGADTLNPYVPYANRIDFSDALYEENLTFNYYEADYYVATWGDDANAGTFDAPWLTWQKAFSGRVAGDTVYIRGGVYYFTDDTQYAAVNIVAANDGTPGAYINIFAYPGEMPILDVSGHRNVTYDQGNGIYMTQAFYWHIKGLTVRHAEQYVAGEVGFAFQIITSGNIIIENCTSHSNGGSGFNIGWAAAGDTITFTNCDSYDNYDPLSATDGGNADGFVAHSESQTAVYLYNNCRAYRCSDDGFDSFANEGKTTYNNCWAFNNGIADGDGNGFKLGGLEDTPLSVPQRMVYNCIAVGNIRAGIIQNGSDCWMNIYNNITYNNAAWGIYFDSNVPAAVINVRNNLSFGNGTYDCENDGHVGVVQDHNSWAGLDDAVTTNADFIGLDTLDLYKQRDITTGLLPAMDLFKLSPASRLVESGVYVGLQYSGFKPDIGAFETTISREMTADTITIVAAVGIDIIELTTRLIKISGRGGAVDVSANPQIEDGTDGQIIILRQTHNTNTVLFENGNGLLLDGHVAFTMDNGDMLMLMYNATNDWWQEISRSDN